MASEYGQRDVAVAEPPVLELDPDLVVDDDGEEKEPYHLMRFGKAGSGEVGEAWCGLKLAFTAATHLDFSMNPCKACIKKKQEHQDNVDDGKKV